MVPGSHARQSILYTFRRDALRLSTKVGGNAKLVNPSNFVSKTFKMVGILGLFVLVGLLFGLFDRRGLDLVRFAHDLDAIPQFGADARTNQGVVVDEKDPQSHAVAHDGSGIGSTSSTSVPVPGEVRMLE